MREPIDIESRTVEEQSARAKLDKDCYRPLRSSDSAQYGRSYLSLPAWLHRLAALRKIASFRLLVVSLVPRCSIRVLVILLFLCLR